MFTLSYLTRGGALVVVTNPKLQTLLMVADALDRRLTSNVRLWKAGRIL